jgi:hypothetical protein
MNPELLELPELIFDATPEIEHAHILRKQEWESINVYLVPTEIERSTDPLENRG